MAVNPPASRRNRGDHLGRVRGETQLLRVGDAPGRRRHFLGLTGYLRAALLVAALAASARAQTSVTLAWNPGPGSAIAGYRLYAGAASRTYTSVLAMGKATTATVSNLVNGATYFFAVTAYDNNGLESDFSSEVSYTIALPTNPAPTVTLTSPANGAGYTAPATIPLAANVTANGHTISQVQFYNGSMLLGAVAAAPYRFSWNNVSAGTCSLTAKAVYDSGGTVRSAVANVTVAAGPPPPGLTFAANAGIISSPFVVTNGVVYQPIQTGAANGGQAAYTFNILNAGTYLVSAMVIAPSAAQNSLYVNIDAEPTDPLMIWDIPLASTLTRHTVSWRGNGKGGAAPAQYSPKVFTLSAGTHQLIVRGRAGNVRLGTISITAAPPTLQIHTGPGGSIILAGTGQAGQIYSVLGSQDLKSWKVLGPVATDLTGSFTFRDLTASGRPSRLYRLQTMAVSAPRLRIHATADGSVILNGVGQSGQTYNVLSSTDLKTWMLIGTLTLDGSGSGQYTDLAASSRPRCLYRLQGQ